MGAIRIMLSITAAAAGAAFVYFGVYNVTATQQHYRPVYWLISTVAERSVASRARKVPMPALGARTKKDRGLMLYRRHCVRCHGAPGVAPDSFAPGLAPLPPNLS